MSRQIKPFITPEEYLDRERKADYKSEYLHGEVFAMTGASRQHNLIAANLSRTLGNQLVDRPCELYVSDMRVKVTASGRHLKDKRTGRSSFPKTEIRKHRVSLSS